MSLLLLCVRADDGRWRGDSDEFIARNVWRVVRSVTIVSHAAPPALARLLKLLLEVPVAVPEKTRERSRRGIFTGET